MSVPDQDPTLQTTSSHAPLPDQGPLKIVHSVGIQVLAMLVVLSGLVLMALLLSERAFEHMQRSVDHMVKTDLESLLATSELANESAAHASAAPALVAAQDDFSRMAVMDQLIDWQRLLGRSISGVKKLRMVAGNAKRGHYLKAVISRRDDLLDNLYALDGVVARRIDLEQKLSDKLLNLQRNDESLARLLPTVSVKDNAQFQTDLLAFGASFHSMSAILHSAIQSNSRGRLKRLKKRVMNKHEQVHHYYDKLHLEQQQLSTFFNAIHAALEGPGNLFQLRQELLGILKKQRGLLNRNKQLASRFNETVARLFDVVREDVRQQTEQVRMVALQTSQQLKAIAAIALLAIILGVLMVRWRLVAPLTQLHRAIVGHLQGDPPEKVMQTGKNEISRISQGLAYFIALIGHREAALRRSKDDAEAAARTKSDFLANMSHEIRTPMNAISGLTNLCLKTDLNSKQRDYLNKVEGASRSLLRIVDDILDFSKVEAGRLELEETDFELESVFDHLSTMISQKAHEKGLEVVYGVPRSVPTRLSGDPLRLSQILINLTSNAVKFTEEGEIVVQVAVERFLDNQVELHFSVRDSGIGMSRAQLDKLFNSFTQADSSTTRRFGGTGLGLTISKRLVEMMNGRIWAVSAMGHGSAFHFTARFECELKPELAPCELTWELQNKRALLVDANPTSRAFLKEVVESFSVQVHWADDTQEGMRKCQQARDEGIPFDVVILDVSAVQESAVGLTLLNDLQKLGGEESLRRTLLIAPVTQEALIRASDRLGIGALQFKPVYPAALLGALRSILLPESAEEGKTQRLIRTTHMDLSGLHLLLVEDNEVNQMVAREMMQGAGAEVTIANHGQAALDMVQLTPFDAVFMDLQMPVMDGYEAAHRIRALPGMHALPIIALSANVMKDQVRRCYEAGMNDHLPKPLDPSAMFRVLAMHLGLESKLEEREDQPLEGEGFGEALEAFPQQPAGMDLHKALFYADGRVSLMCNLLQRFELEQSSVLSDLRQKMALDERDEARRLAHTLKGVAGMLGAEVLQNRAKTVEDILAGDLVSGSALQAQLAPQLAALEEQLTVVLNSVQEVLASPGAVALLGEQVEAVDHDVWMEQLHELASLIDDYNAEAEDLAAKMLKSNGDERLVEPLKAVMKAVSGFDFELAAEQIQQVTAIANEDRAS
ncbi:response regulator [Magnetococcus sp. PR-3]|uniref:response regulator n=1 Tax=Magnetococcus sp. PR-3 TaxID=3120355 RepID=UPI002FCDF872